MKISEKEKNLLFIVGALLIVALYFQFVFLKQRSDVTDLEKQRDDVKNKYTATMSLVNSIDKKNDDLMNLNLKISEKSDVLYPAIIQEKIILELDKLIRTANISANLSFSEVAVKKIELPDVEERQQGESVLQTYKEQYDGETSSDNNKSSSIDSNNNNDLNVEQINVKMSYIGTYAQLTDFINEIEKHSKYKRIVMTNLTGDMGKEGILKGNFELNFYSVPKIDDSSDDYFKYTLSSTLGKSNPFDGQFASSSKAQAVSFKNDFLIVARPSKSDLATVSIRYAPDTKMDSTIFADNEGVEEAEITLIQENGKYYYKFKTSKGSYPKNYLQNKIEFTPQGSDIIIMAMSSIRIDEEDKSGVNLKVVNNTDKTVKVYVKGEDPSRPRITLADGNKVNSQQSN